MITVKLRCRLTVRFEWDVDPGYAHPAVTWGCVESREGAARCAENIRTLPRGGVRLVGVSTREAKSAHWIPVYYTPLEENARMQSDTRANMQTLLPEAQSDRHGFCCADCEDSGTTELFDVTGRLLDASYCSCETGEARRMADDRAAQARIRSANAVLGAISWETLKAVRAGLERV